jgi:hypothetical protein
VSESHIGWNGAIRFAKERVRGGAAARRKEELISQRGKDDANTASSLQKRTAVRDKPEMPYLVVPTKVGIQAFAAFGAPSCLDPGLRRDDQC